MEPGVDFGTSGDADNGEGFAEFAEANSIGAGGNVPRFSGNARGGFAGNPPYGWNAFPLPPNFRVNSRLTG